MIRKNNIYAFVIGLERNLHRRKYIEDHFSERNVTFEWFSAVDGLTLSCKDTTNYCPHSYLNNRWELTPFEIGCFESHRRIWNIIIERSLDNALIFEDDVYLVPSFLRRIASIIDTGLEFDLIKLDAYVRMIRLGTLNLQIGGIQIRRLMSPISSSAAYMVSKQGCISLVERSEVYCDPLDGFITKNWTEERIYQLFPALAVQQRQIKEFQVDGMSKVSNVYESQRRKIDMNFPQRKKGPLWFIIKRELRRFGRKIFAIFYSDIALIRKGGIVTKVKLLKDG